MIRLLKGMVDFIDSTHIIVDVQGVGYYVYASRDVFSSIQGIGAAIQVFTYLHVREDILELYGFATMEDLKLFESFLSVSGIGPKTAIGIFAVGSRDKIKQAILQGDVSFFSGVPRLGKKNAQKIIIELKGKVDALLDASSGIISADDTEVIDALKTFGFSTPEIHQALHSFSSEELSIEEKIKRALKYLGK